MSLETRKGAALEDQGAHVVDQLTALWERYGRLAAGGVIGVAVVIAGAVFYTRSRAATEELAAGKLAEANVQFWQGDYQRSLDAAKQVYAQYGSTPSGRDAHRLAGDNAYWLGDYKAAVDEYRKFLAGAPSDMLTDAGRRSLAYALENSKQYQEASDLYDGLVGKFDRESSAEFLAASARCRVALNQPAEAAKRLQRLLDDFGDTSLAPRAQSDLGALRPTGS